MDPCLRLGSAANFVGAQRILSPISPSKPTLTKHDEPIFTGMVSRQSQLHSGRCKMGSRHFHVIWPAEFNPLGRPYLTAVRDQFG
jgi:hypothetical protein